LTGLDVECLAGIPDDYVYVVGDRDQEGRGAPLSVLVQDCPGDDRIGRPFGFDLLLSGVDLDQRAEDADVLAGDALPDE
jgi:hypothetical protein